MTVGFEPATAARRRVRERATTVIAVKRAGVLAHAVCRRGAAAHVAAIFQRSFYLRAGEMLLCVGEPAIGNGPLTLIVGDDVRLSGLDLRPGEAALISEREIVIGERVQLCLDACEVWRSPAWPNAAPPAVLIETCEALASRVGAASAGLAPVAFGAPAPTPFARIASERIAQFRSWLVEQTVGWAKPRSSRRARADQRMVGTLRFAHPTGESGRSKSAPAAVRDLVGLGPGLTPSGDDFLTGALAVLDAIGEADVRATLARVIMQALPGRTSPLSACLLRAACAGHVGERLHDAVSALLVGDVEAAIEAAENIGDSSGRDMLAGAAMVILGLLL
jgi:Protein of unknown function (DUF2877)